MDIQTPEAGVPTASPTVPDIAALSPADRHTWRLTGEAPSGASADSPSAPSGDQSASTDATAQPAASEPAKPADKPPKNVKTRNLELAAEIAELNRKLEMKRQIQQELHALDRPAQTKPAESSPAKPTQSEWQRYKSHPDAPKVDSFETYEDYLDARAAFIADQRYAEREQAQQRQSHARELETEISQIQQSFNERVAAFAKTDPEFRAKVHPELLNIPTVFQCIQAGQKPEAHNAIVEEITKSEVPGQLLVHFSTPEGQKEWQRLLAVGAKDGASMLRLFGRIEARFEKRDEPAAPVVPAKTITSAPEPPTTLGKKPGEPVDAAKVALQSGDFRAYKRLKNAEDLAHR